MIQVIYCPWIWKTGPLDQSTCMMQKPAAHSTRPLTSPQFFKCGIREVWFPFKFFILNIIIELTQFNKKWVYLNTLRTQSMIQSIKIRLTTCITKRKSKLTSQKSMFIGSTTNLHDSFIQTFFLNHLKILKHAHWLSISSKWM